MKNLSKQLVVGLSFMIAFVFSNVMSAQQQAITLDWTPGGWAYEVGWEIVQVSNGAVVHCEATLGANPASQTINLDENNTYNVYGYDDWGDGWNGGNLEVLVSGVSLGNFTLAGGGNPNSCNGSYSGGPLLGSFTVAAPCDITCPADITVDNDPGECGAQIDVPLPEVGTSCDGAFQYATASTGNVPFQFNSTGIITTYGTLPGAVSVIGDVILDIEVVGDFGAGFELFQLRGPDGSIVFSQGGVTPGDCNTANVSTTVAQSTWNNWVSSYGSDLEFYTVADADVDNICSSSYWAIDASMPTSALASVNDYNNTDDATDFYGVGTTTVTFTTFSNG